MAVTRSRYRNFWHVMFDESQAFDGESFNTSPVMTDVFAAVCDTAAGCGACNGPS
jgi:hypothetical protein